MTFTTEIRVLVPTIYVGCSGWDFAHAGDKSIVLVPTIYVGCSGV